MTPSTHSPRRSGHASNHGITLTEVMIGMVTGLFLLAALAVVFARSSAAQREIDRVSQQIENGRHALQLLRDEVHLAGYYGGPIVTAQQATGACVPRSGVPATAAALGWQESPPQAPLPIQGYAAGDIPPGESCFTNIKPNTDVLIVRSVDPVASTVAAVADPANATDWFLQSSMCADAAVDAPARPFIVGTGGAGAPATFKLHQKDCATPAAVRRLVVRAYYVGKCSTCTGSGDGIPSLRMVELTGAAASSAAVVEGIESMRVDYAIDADGDGAAETLKRCKTGADACSASDWANVVGVQIHLLARTPSPSPGHVDAKVYDMGLAGPLNPFGDGYKRHRFGALIAAYNRTGPRER